MILALFFLVLAPSLNVLKHNLSLLYTHREEICKIQSLTLVYNVQ